MSTVLSTVGAEDQRRAIPAPVLNGEVPGRLVHRRAGRRSGSRTPGPTGWGPTGKEQIANMEQLPIDTTVMSFIASGPPEPVLDFDTRQPKCDENGVPLYAVSAMSTHDGLAKIVVIKVPGEPKNIAFGTVLRVTGLVGLPWFMDDRSGVAYRATAVEAGSGLAKTERSAS